LISPCRTSGRDARTICLAVAAAWLWFAPARALAAPRVPTRLYYEDAVCGVAEDFSARVLRRNGAVRFVSSGERVVVRLRIERRDGALDARVSISGRGRAPMSRRIESPDCNDALDALALVVAIGIEGRSEGARGNAHSPARPTPPVAPAPEPAPAPPAAPEPEPPAPPPEPPAPEPAPAPPPEAPVVAPPPAPPPRVDEGAAAPPPEPPEPRLAFGAGLSALASLGIAPDPLFGGAVYVVAGWESQGAFAPELVLGLSHQWLDGYERPGGDADFALNAANVELCPVRWALGVLSARPCAAAWFGRFSSEGYETYEARSATRPWATLGASAELNARFGPLELRGALGAGVPLVRDGFRFGGQCSGSACAEDAFHEVSPVIWSFAFGAGAGFW
jgi:hypothetical protein